MSDKQSSEMDLRGYLAVLNRRRVIGIVTIAVVLGASLLYSYLQEPVYAGKALILLQPRTEESPFDPNTGQRTDPGRVVSTEIEILLGPGVREDVRQRSGSAPSVSARSVGATDVIAVTARNTDPQRAADVANLYANAYIDFKRKRAVDDLLAAAKEIQASLNDIQRQIDALDAQVAAAAPNLQQLARDSTSAQKTALVQQLGLFKQTLDQLQVSARLRTGGAQLVGSAPVPTTPVSPRPVRDAILALFVGAMLATLLCFFAEHLDDSLETQQDLERLAGTVPVIALIPAVRGWKPKDSPRLIAMEDPRAAASEAYRTLRTAIQFIAIEHPMGVVQVTSPQASEGKSTTLANLAVTLATSGQRVIVVCCDLRRPRIHKFFGLSNDVGLTSVLVGSTPLRAALQSVPNVPNLKIIASGPLPPNPSELLSSTRTADLLAALRTQADMVLLDSPPILPVSDALVLFRHVDATLMVFSALATKRKHGIAALAKARQVDAPLVGAVLNGVSTRSGAGYGYAYGYADDSKNDASSSSTNGRGAGDARATDQPRFPLRRR